MLAYPVSCRSQCRISAIHGEYCSPEGQPEPHKDYPTKSTSPERTASQLSQPPTSGHPNKPYNRTPPQNQIPQPEHPTSQNPSNSKPHQTPYPEPPKKLDFFLASITPIPSPQFHPHTHKARLDDTFQRCHHKIRISAMTSCNGPIEPTHLLDLEGSDLAEY